MEMSSPSTLRVDLNQKSSRLGHIYHILPTFIAVAAALSVGSVSAFEIDTGSDDVKIRFDNSVRYTLGKRMKAQEDLLIDPAKKAYNSDDGNRAFSKGDITVNRVDLFSELDVVYQKQHGVRFSAAAWNDNVYSGARYSDQAVSNVNHLENGKQAFGLSDTTKKYARRSGELLDAFAFTGFNVGDAKVNLKLGKTTSFWGEGLFNAANSLSYSQSSLDLAKAFQQPGVEVKELFLPRKQFLADITVTPELSFSAQKFLDWDPVRYPNAGTYLGFLEPVGLGAETFLGASGLPLTRGEDIVNDKKKDFGLAAKYSPDWASGSIGFYVRRYTDIQPALVATPGQSFYAASIVSALAQQNTTFANLVKANGLSRVIANYSAGAYDGALTGTSAGFKSTVQLAATTPTGTGTFNQVFPGKVDLLGISYGRNLGGLAFGSEISYRKNNPLVSFPVFVVPNAANRALLKSSLGNQFQFVASAPTADDDLVARGNTWHALVNVLSTLSDNGIWETGSWAAELNYIRLGSVTKNKALFKQQDWYEGLDKPTKNTFGINLAFTPGWFSVFPSADLFIPVSLSRGISGNAPVTGAINKGNGSYSIGARIEYQSQYTFELRYIGYTGKVEFMDIDNSSTTATALSTGGAPAVLRDRNQLVFTFKTAF